MINEQGLKREELSSSSHQSKLIAYLDEFGKQIHSRKNTNTALEQQLLSLSKAYNQAQQKLLETEKALMAESILLEKQRSVMEIYRHILSEEMDDEGIVSFVQKLQQEQPNRQIFQELGQIKSILSRKNMKSCRRSMEDSRALQSLKKQVSRLDSQRRQIEQSSELMSDQNYELQVAIKRMEQQNLGLRRQLNEAKSQICNKDQQIHAFRESTKKDAQQLVKKSIKVQQLTKKVQWLNIMEEFIKETIVLLQTKLNIKIVEQKQNVSCNKSQSHSIAYKNLRKEYLHEAEQKINQLIKYKCQYKKMKDHTQTMNFLQKQVILLKLFLSEEALFVTKEYQQKKLDCIESELRNLAVLQKNKIIKLQDCQKDVWKYKLQLMKDQLEPNLHFNSTLLSKEGLNAGETFRQTFGSKKKVVESTIANQISQFDI